MKKRFYITTPIYYINDVPHIGHTCTTVISDIVARFYRQKGREVFFRAGTDEHGAKVAEAAEKAGLDPQEFCDQVSKRFKEAWKLLNISHDFFFRTTSPKHEKVVRDLLVKVYKKGDIYKDKYEGLYCIGCEKFLTETDLEEGHCPLHPPEKTVTQSEENYFFKLSEYVPQLIKLIENDKTNYIYPEGKRREILTKLKGGVRDISVSREKVKWGIPLPWDQSHTIYVWIDALINYYSATRFLDNKEKFWPADLHLIGKEILWFHTVIWQALLLSAGKKLPDKVFAHSFYTIESKKMSKSLGNVISPGQLEEKFGTDAARFLIASSFPGKNDSDIGWNKFNEKYNADLANNLGNLVSRVSSLAQKFQTVSPKTKTVFWKKVEEKIQEIDPVAALDFIWQEKIDACNLYLNQEKPWKKDRKQARKILKKAITQLQKIGHNIAPFMPETSEKIRNIFKPGKVSSPPEKPLFPRIKE